jgi:hypothetical protein
MKQTKRQKTAAFFDRMTNLGFSHAETDALVKAERALSRFAELECGISDCNRSISVFRDEETGRPFYRIEYRVGNEWKTSTQPKRDTEKAALQTVARILESKPGFSAYHQTDPRGVSLYIIRPGDIEAGEDVRRLYNRGLAMAV